MANRYFIGADGSALNTTENWSDSSGGAGGSSIPNTTTDVAIFDANSGSPTLTASFDVWQCDLSAYPTGKKIAIGNYLFKVRSNFTGNAYSPFSSGTGTVYLGYLTTTATWATNGVEIDAKVIMQGTGAKTLTGNMTVNGLLTVSANQSINGAGTTITCKGGASFGTVSSSGTTTFVFAGGTISTTNATSGGCNNPKKIDAGSGTVTFGTYMRGFGNLTYVSGTVVTTGSTYVMAGAGTLTTDLGETKMEFNNFTHSDKAFTLGSDLTINGVFTFGSNDQTLGHATYKIYAKGGVTAEAAYITFSGQGLWIQGGVIKSGASAGHILGNVTFDGDCSFYQAGAGVASTRFRNANLYYNSGTVTTTDALVVVSGNCSFYVGENITWDELSIGNRTQASALTSTLTVVENLKCDTFYLSPETMTAGAAATLSIATGKKLITRELYTSENEFTSCTISSAGTGYVNCTGTFADKKVFGCAFTNINAAESETPIFSWQGVVTNCVNVYSVNGQDIWGGGVSVAIF